MKVFFVNTVAGQGSTGRICCALAEAVEAAGGKSRIAYGRGSAPEAWDDRAVRLQSERERWTDALLTRLSDRAGCFSRAATRLLIDEIERFDPDVVHLHNLHGYYLHVEMLLSYLADSGRAVVWTLHDCWPLTGHCCHFSRIGCDGYLHGCHRCPARRAYPASWLVSRAASNYSRKRAAIAAIPQLQPVAPSRWLGDIVDRAALTASPAAVIPNGIDLLAFRSPSAQTVADLRERYGLVGKRVVLGVASVWSESKGLPLLCALPPLLGAQYRVVVVGLDERLRRTLPPGVLGLASTASTDELAALYGAADVFVNPSLEETMGMTTVEAMACGTPVVVSNRTAVPEVVPKEGGIVVGEYTPAAFADGVRAAAEGCFTPRSVAERYGNDRMCGNYLELYRAVIRATRAERGK